jgi:hypothetical protein
VSDVRTIQRYARAAGVAMLLSVVFGFLGEQFIPGMFIVRGNAGGTAARILASPELYRLGFASYLVEGCCDVALCLLFYVVLEPVDRNLALMSAFFGIASMAIFAVAESSYFAAYLLIHEATGLSAFSPDQRNALALFALRLYGTIAYLFLALYGIASMLRGLLIMRSRHLPRALGAMLVAGGAGFFLRTATFILAPAYSSDLFLLPMGAAGVLLMLWLLVRGVDPAGLTRLGGSGGSTN